MLYLYSGITPNNTSTHYYFSNFTKYLDFLNDYKIKEINADKYTINTFQIRIKLDASISELDYKNVTYIINTSDSVCYFVNNSKIQSGYIFFNISIDNWGTYISKASLENINVKRTNRKISENGIYDYISHTGNYEIDVFEDTVYDFNNTNIVLLVRVQGGMVFCLTGVTRDFIAPYIPGGTFRMWGELTYVLSLLNGYVENFLENPHGVEMSILHAYIVPSNCVIASSDSTHIGIRESAEQFWITVNKVYTSTSKLFTKEININHRHTIGGVNGNLTFNNLTRGTVTPLYYFSYSLDEVKIIITDGDAQQEITKSFELPLANVDRSVKASEEISSVLRYFLGVAQIGVGLSRKSPLSITKGIGTIGNQITNDIERNSQSNIKGVNIVATGSAITSYGSNITNLVSPFKCFKATSLIDEEKHARKLGANFNEYLEDLPTLFTYELLGTGTEDETYLQADIEVSAIPTDAITEITNKFSNGIHMIYVL